MLPEIKPLKKISSLKIYGDITTIFIRSNRGNYVLKCYVDNIKEELTHLINGGLRFFYRLLGHWYFYDITYTIIPRNTKSKQRLDRRFRIQKHNITLLSYRRLPKTWIKTFDKL